MHVPTVKDFVLLFLKRLKQNPINYYAQLHAQYGDIFHKRYGGYDYYHTCSPQHIEYILSTHQDNFRKTPKMVNMFKPFIGECNLLTTNNMPQWHRDRELSKAVFESAVHFDNYAKVVTTKCQNMMNEWRRRLATGPLTLPIGHEMDVLIINVVNDTILCEMGLEPDSFATNIGNIFKTIIQRSYAVTQLPWILPTKKRREYLAQVKWTRDLSRKVMRARLASHKDYDDLAGALMHEYNITDEDSTEFSDLCYHLTLMEVVGHLTTGGGLSWAFVLLAQHPEAEQRIVAEVAKVCGNNPPSYADLAKLTYTQAFICEVLRMYPPFTLIARQVIESDTIQGYTIPANAIVIMNNYQTHRHPTYWSDPLKFEPERFLTKKWGQDYQYAYNPFGTGKRTCLGKNFAFMEMCLIVAMVSQQFRLIIPNSYQGEIKIKLSSPVSIRSNVETMEVQAK